LIDQDQIPYAYATFKEMRSLLERYTSNDAFSALETEVNYARKEYEKKAEHCRQYAKELNRLVKTNKGTTAFRKFRSHRRELEKYLDQETFAELKKSIYEAYKKTPARGKKRG
jgi:superfamily II DNA or RNA helicase